MGYDSEMDGCGRCMKNSLFIVNFVIFLGGVTLAGLSIYSLVQKVDYLAQLTGSTMISGTVYVLLVASIAVAVVSFLGCYGALREIKCMLFMYSIIVSLLFVVILIAGIFGYVYRENVPESLQKHMQDSIQLYKVRKDITVGWDFAQETFECCGVRGWQDWGRFDEALPESCCKKDKGRPIPCNAYPDNVNQYTTHQTGCVRKMKEFMQMHALLLGTTGFIVAFLMLLGMIFSCALFKMI